VGYDEEKCRHAEQKSEISSCSLARRDVAILRKTATSRPCGLEVRNIAGDLSTPEHMETLRKSAVDTISSKPAFVDAESIMIIANNVVPSTGRTSTFHVEVWKDVVKVAARPPRDSILITDRIRVVGLSDF
jgi:hypothetical protein